MSVAVLSDILSVHANSLMKSSQVTAARELIIEDTELEITRAKRNVIIKTEYTCYVSQKQLNIEHVEVVAIL